MKRDPQILYYLPTDVICCTPDGHSERHHQQERCYNKPNWQQLEQRESFFLSICSIYSFVIFYSSIPAPTYFSYFYLVSLGGVIRWPGCLQHSAGQAPLYKRAGPPFRVPSVVALPSRRVVVGPVIFSAVVSIKFFF